MTKPHYEVVEKTKRKKYVIDNNELMREWNYDKNNSLDLYPDKISYGSGTKVWWMCSKGHEWEAKIANRTIGDGCPICSGHKVLIGYNDLATTNPQIANEWHPTKNGELKSTDVTSGSNRKVWWICKKGHEWNDTISHRNGGRGCPICSKELKTSFPEQAIFYYLNKITTTYNRYKIDRYTEIDIFLPEYNIGIEYDGIYYHTGKRAEEREKRKEETLYKLGIELIRIKEDINDNRFKNTIFSKPGVKDDELNYIIQQVVEYINKSKGAKLLNIDIDIKRDRNEIYNQYINLEKERSLLAINPNIAAEWHPIKNGKLLPEHVSVSSNKKVWWICKNGHEWIAMVNTRNKGIGCPYCSGKKVITGITDLKTLNPKLASEWHPEKNNSLTPDDVTIASNRKVWWMCQKGHEWKSSVYDRNKGNNCPICSGRKVLTGYNDLATLNPKLVKEWHPTKNGNLTPFNVTIGSDKKVWWICEKGHEWEAHIYSRNHGYGCPYCAGQKVIKGVNDLKTTNPKLAEEWHPIKNGDLTPSDVMAGSTKKVWWLCKDGHEWETHVYSRNSGSGCPICYKMKRNIKVDK